MKKIFFVFGLIGIITLTSCGAQEECRNRAAYVSHQQVIKSHISTPVAVSEYTQNIN